MIIVRAAESAEQTLADGRMRSPRHGCGDTLKRWGYGRCRRVRGLGADTIDVRPRRVRCCGCGATQVLLPAALQPRRADSTEVIGTALARKAEGLGYRRIAAALDRSPSTVRRWCVAPAAAVISTSSGSAGRKSSSGLMQRRSTDLRAPATCCGTP